MTYIRGLEECLEQSKNTENMTSLQMYTLCVLCLVRNRGDQGSPHWVSCAWVGRCMASTCTDIVMNLPTCVLLAPFVLASKREVELGAYKLL